MSISENSVTWKIRVEPAFEKVEMLPEIFERSFLCILIRSI